MFILSGVINLNENALERFFDIRIELFHNHFFLGAFNILLALVFVIIGSQNIEHALKNGKVTSSPEFSAKDLEERVEQLEKIVSELQNSNQ